MKAGMCVVIVSVILVGLSVAQQKKHTANASHGGVAAQLEQIEHTWAAAEVKGDAAMISPYLDETMVQTNPDGSVSARKEVLEGIAKGDPTLRAVDLADMKTQSYGDAAVIMGNYTERREAGGKRTATSGRFTDTYIRRSGKWKCVASHDSVAAKE